MMKIREAWQTAVHHLTIPGLFFIVLGLLLMASGLGYHLHWLGMAAPVPGFEDWFKSYLEVSDSIMAAGFLVFTLGVLIAVIRLLKVTLGKGT